MRIIIGIKDTYGRTSLVNLLKYSKEYKLAKKIKDNKDGIMCLTRKEIQAIVEAGLDLSHDLSASGCRNKALKYFVED